MNIYLVTVTIASACALCLGQLADKVMKLKDDIKIQEYQQSSKYKYIFDMIQPLYYAA